MVENEKDDLAERLERRADYLHGRSNLASIRSGEAFSAEEAHQVIADLREAASALRYSQQSLEQAESPEPRMCECDRNDFDEGWSYCPDCGGHTYLLASSPPEREGTDYQFLWHKAVETIRELEAEREGTARVDAQDLERLYDLLDSHHPSAEWQFDNRDAAALARILAALKKNDK